MMVGGFEVLEPMEREFLEIKTLQRMIVQQCDEFSVCKCVSNNAC